MPASLVQSSGAVPDASTNFHLRRISSQSAPPGHTIRRGFSFVSLHPVQRGGAGHGKPLLLPERQIERPDVPERFQIQRLDKLFDWVF